MHPGCHPFPEEQRQARRRAKRSRRGQSILSQLLVMSNQFVVSLATVELILASVVFFGRVPDRARSFAGAPSPGSVPGFVWPGLGRSRTDRLGVPAV